jgi:hypothetical protein
LKRYSNLIKKSACSERTPGDVYSCFRQVRLPMYKFTCPGLFPKNPENAVSTFERKILRRIYGPVQDKCQWRIRYNKDLYHLYDEPDLVTCIN